MIVVEDIKKTHPESSLTGSWLVNEKRKKQDVEFFFECSQSLFDEVCQRRGVFSNQFLLKLVKCAEVVHRYLTG